MSKARESANLISEYNIYSDINNNNVGIGTTNPTQRLDVNGNIRIRSGLYDGFNNVGTAGSILVSNGTNVYWDSPVGAGAQGIIGPQGTQGVQGTQGTQGVQGIQGIDGTLGSEGAQGIQGTTGTQGIQGIDGTLGSQGTQGIDGTLGSQGTQGIDGTLGSQGTQGIQGTTGSQGIQGIQGITGSQGTQGTIGSQGTQGIQGISGTLGSQGIQGIQGLQGIQGGGSDGSQGIQGIQGITGSQGTTGTIGVQGANNGGFTIIDDVSTSATRYIIFESATSGIVTTANIATTKLTFNPSSGELTATQINDSGGNIRALTNNAKGTSYTLAIGDVGELINITTGGVTVPSGIFSAGDNITIYNNSTSSQTITQGSGVTLRLVGTTSTGNRTLDQRGLATVLCVASNEFVISGGGLS